MTNQSSGRLRRICGIALSAALVIAGLCLMIQCLRIYTSPEGIFSRETVAQYFAPIAVPVWLCAVLAVLGIVLELFLPASGKKLPPEKNYPLILERLHEKKDLSACDESLRRAVALEQTRRKRHKIVTILLLLLGSVLFLVYALQEGSFHQHQINASMIRAMTRLIPAMAVPFGYALFAAWQNRASILREIELMKQVQVPLTTAPVKKPAQRTPGLLRWTLLVLALGVLIYGYAAGGTADVLTKAINICTECVGLG